MLDWCNGNTFGYIHRKFVGSSPIFNTKTSLSHCWGESSFAAMIAVCFCLFSHPAAVSYTVKIRDKADRRLTVRTDEQLILPLGGPADTVGFDPIEERAARSGAATRILSACLSFSFLLKPPRVRAEVLTYYYPSSDGVQSCSSQARGTL